MLSELGRKKYEHDQIHRDKVDWKHYIQCDGTPNPLVVQQLNTYMYEYMYEKEEMNIKVDQHTYVNKCLEIFKIMDVVDDVVDLPLDFSKI